MMNYYNYKVDCDPFAVDILIALFSTMPFEAFQEVEGGFHAFIPEKDWDGGVEKLVHNLQVDMGFDVEREFIPYKNWNEEWEKNFDPVLVDDFCGIRADFHPPFENVTFDLVINPKMAFGTGHHETTYMMIKAMQSLDIQDKKILDFGCGTGILAILAARLNAATPINAVDIEKESYLNTIENAAKNDVNSLQVFQGSLEVIEDGDYDIILANINRNVILQYLPMLHKKLKPNGLLLMSGLLKEDEHLVLTNATENHFTPIKHQERGKWICQLYQT